MMNQEKARCCADLCGKPCASRTPQRWRQRFDAWLCTACARDREAFEREERAADALPYVDEPAELEPAELSWNYSRGAW